MHFVVPHYPATERIEREHVACSDGLANRKVRVYCTTEFISGVA